VIVKLTNAVKGFEDKKFLLNTDVIISVYEGVTEEGNPTTFVYGQNDKTWQIKESVIQVEKLLKL
jgi:hypothetical protein